MDKSSLDAKFARIREHWRPKVVARLNGQELKLVKFQSVFPWHRHDGEDELFLVWRGRMAVEFRDRGGARHGITGRAVHRSPAAKVRMVPFEPPGGYNMDPHDPASIPLDVPT